MKNQIAADYDFEITKVHKLSIVKERNDGSHKCMFYLFSDLFVKDKPDGYLECLTGMVRFDRKIINHQFRLAREYRDSTDVTHPYDVHYEFNRKINPHGEHHNDSCLTLFIDGVVISNDVDLRYTLLNYVETLASKTVIEHFEIALPYIYRNLCLTGSSYFVNHSGAKKSHVLITRYV